MEENDRYIKCHPYFIIIFLSNFSYFSQQQYFSNKQFPVNWSSLLPYDPYSTSLPAILTGPEAEGAKPQPEGEVDS